MRAVVQRVNQSCVVVDNKIVGSINKGLTVLLGVDKNDTSRDLEYMAEKIVNLRIFEDASGKMNLSALDIGGELLVISQFTLFGDCRKGKRPSFTNAAPPDYADKLYKEFVKYIKDKYPIKVETGIFQAEMQLEIHNDGPVTILLDSSKLF
ncbi:MAG: D-aminoacyl-tRNA deacylase [Ruminiclostridium sp.]|nr:D-aminoacyl-tRNA deacylase [Ruminiclostridium sp.]